MEFFKRYASVMVCFMWVFVACRFMARKDTKLRPRPNVAEITENMRMAKVVLREDYNELEPVILCESSGVHKYVDGRILRGIKNQNDIGIAQINTFHHERKAHKLGYNIYSLKGNLAYAKYLFDHEGKRPWNSSKRCWGKKSYSTASNR